MNRSARVNLATLLVTILQLGLLAPAALASFAGTDVVLPSVGRGSGQGGSQWYTTLWVHNPGSAAVNVQLSLYLRDQVNPAPDGVYNDSIPPGDTRRYADAVSTLFGVTGFGALRVTAAQPVVVNGRIYSVNAGGTEAASWGVTGTGPAGSGHLGGEEVAVYGLTDGSEVISVHGVANGTNSVGVYGLADSGALAVGVYGKSSLGYAGFFNGKVHVFGDLNVTGTKNFRVDHPLDPEGAYLVHAAVESDQVLNLYSGTVILDGSGRASVELPAWFDAVNRDLRYQLTSIGGFAPVYVAEEVRDRRFVIAGGSPGLKVSWQVTGVRSDPWMELHPFRAEMPKHGGEAGSYLCPECYGQPASRSLVPPPSQPLAE